MSRTYHHHAQKHIKRRLEVWSKRCRAVSMATFGRWIKRVTHRYERRQAKAVITEQLWEPTP